MNVAWRGPCGKGSALPIRSANPAELKLSGGAEGLALWRGAPTNDEERASGHRRTAMSQDASARPRVPSPSQFPSKGCR
jgi:hypothetical protein